jgi:hypothetical protein
MKKKPYSVKGIVCNYTGSKLDFHILGVELVLLEFLFFPEPSPGFLLQTR